MRTTTTDGIKYTYPDANIWKQERQLIYCERVSGTNTAIILRTSPYSGDIATYTLDANGKAVIDVTDYVRTYFIAGTAKSLYLKTPGNYLQVTMTIVGLINPANVIIPFQPLAAGGAVIIPPTKMYFTNLYDDVRAELYTTSGTWSVSGMGTIGTGGRFIGQVDGDFDLYATGYAKKYTPQPMKCDEQYCVVRWVSFTGQERKHIFVVKKQTISAAIGYSLLHPENIYDDIKSRTDGFTLYLDGLDQYDYWYYADVICSSKVEISLDSVNFTQVQVTTKNVSIPDGNNFDGKIEIAVNWKRYDSVAM